MKVVNIISVFWKER